MHGVWFLAPAAAALVVALAVGPVRRAWRNGLRCAARHPILWQVPAGFSLAYGLAHAALSGTLDWRGGSAVPPLIAIVDDPFSTVASELLPGQIVPAGEMLAATLNCLVATFPVSVLAALLVFLNWRGATSEFRRALCRRLGGWGWVAFAGLLVTAAAALTKPFLLALLPELAAVFSLATILLAGSLLNALAFAFEFFFGTAVQLLLLLTAYGWVAGRSFPRDRMIPFAVRRLGFVFKWALVLVTLSLVLIHLPLLLETALTGAPATWPVEMFVRPALALAMILCAGVQIRLALHNDSLRGALAANAAFWRRHATAAAGFLLCALGIFLTLEATDVAGAVWLGPSVASVAWQAVFPAVTGAISGWLLAAWVCFYASCEERVRDWNF